MTKCQHCEKEFLIEEEDIEFYNKLNVPGPTHCPDCRAQRRMAYRNERCLYNRTCDFSKEKIISIYSEDKPFKIYRTDIWWSDKWDALEYGQDFDFSRPFFEQFKELRMKVPRPALTITANENSPFVNQCWYSKNCHLCFDMGFTEDAMYCYITYHSRNLVDNSFTRDCELCYYLVDCQKCYNCSHLQDCNNCSDSYFSFDCKGCNNVIFCYNLRNKSYQIFNKDVTKEEFNKFIAEMKQGSYKTYSKYLQIFKEQVLKAAIHRYTHNLNTENCTGDYILNSKNCKNCFVIDKSQDLKYAYRCDERIFDSMDINNASICELVYDGMCINGVNLKYCTYTYNDVSDAMYCDLTMSSSNCFGCIGVQHKSYCILNKQYSKEEYEKLLPRIIEHMKKTGEWGEFFSIQDSPFCYNETIAQETYPLTEEEAKKQGLIWKEKDVKDYQKQTIELPDLITDAAESITQEILACEDCGKNYKIIPQELKFYKKQGLPLPRKCNECRHIERVSLRNPAQLFAKSCENCGKSIETSYPKNSPLIIFCEDCYLKHVV